MSPDDWINEAMTALEKNGVGHSDPMDTDPRYLSFRDDEHRRCFVLTQVNHRGKIDVGFYRQDPITLDDVGLAVHIRHPSTECVFRTEFDPMFPPEAASRNIEDECFREQRVKEDCRREQKGYNKRLAWRVSRRRHEIMCNKEEPEYLDWWPLIQGSDEMAEKVLMSLK